MKIFKAAALSAAAVVAIGVVAAAGCGVKKDEGVSAVTGTDLVGTDEGDIVKWEGRYEFRQGEGDSPDMVYLYHTATGFTVEFVGTELIVGFWSEVINTPYYNVAVDDETLPTANAERIFSLQGGYEEITVVSGLEYGEHTVTCLKTSEVYDATTAVYFVETDGKFVYRDSEEDNSNFRFMFVCASGGSGHGALAYGTANSRPSRTTRNSSSLVSFNYLTARMFDADVQYVSCSGWGVKYPKSISEVLDYTGITIENTVAAAQKTALWDYQSWIPDVIIFNIGGNDTVSSGFDRATYQSEVVAMVKKLHVKYPSAKMIWTHTGSNAGSYALSAISDAGIDYVYECVIPGVGEGETGAGTYGANNHSSLKTHIDAANAIVQTMSDVWGFVPIRSNIAFEEMESIIQKF